MPFFLCFHRYSRFYCYFLSANSALGKGAARKRAAKESYIIFAAQFAAHSRKAEYRPAAIPLPQGEYSKKHGKCYGWIRKYKKLYTFVALQR